MNTSVPPQLNQPTQDTVFYAPRLGRVRIEQFLDDQAVRVRHTEFAATTTARLSELQPG